MYVCVVCMCAYTLSHYSVYVVGSFKLGIQRSGKFSFIISLIISSIPFPMICLSGNTIGYILDLQK